nr:hypothetical protein [Rhizobium leguminosarum]
MARHLGRQLLGAGLKAQADAAAEFAIPDPEQTGGEMRRSGPGVPSAIRNEIVEKP